jgi:hypothetical protein
VLRKRLSALIRQNFDLGDMKWDIERNYTARKIVIYIFNAERQDVMVRTPTLYSGDPITNLGPETGYPNRIFLDFLCNSRSVQ